MRELGLLPHADVGMDRQRCSLRHHRACRRRLVFGFGRRATLRVRMRVAGEYRVRRANHQHRTAALLHPDRARSARRGHQLSLSPALRVRGSRPGSDRARRTSIWMHRSPRAPWCDWTTDAPFRETAEAIELRRREGILAVEMEAAALYAFAAAWSRPVICLAHVSNRLGCVEGDFEKGEGDGASSSLELAMMLAAAWVREAVGHVAAAE